MMKIYIFKKGFLGQYMSECAFVNPNEWQIIGGKKEKLVPLNTENCLLHEIGIFILKFWGKFSISFGRN